MPRVKDLTGDIAKLRASGALPQGVAPVMPQVHKLERKFAFNGPGLFFWLLIGFFLALQGFFLFWLAM